MVRTKFVTSISSTNPPPPVIQIILGEGTAVCRVLRARAKTGALKSSVLVARWQVQLILLNKETYSPGRAPSNSVLLIGKFGQLGGLNVLLATVPLPSSRSSVLHTETLCTGPVFRELFWNAPTILPFTVCTPTIVF